MRVTICDLCKKQVSFANSISVYDICSDCSIREDLIKIEKGHKSNLKIIFEITFHQGAFCMKPLEDIDNSRSVSFICYRDQLIREGHKADVSKYIEKIGNIYENKNLLPWVICKEKQAHAMALNAGLEVKA